MMTPSSDLDHREQDHSGNDHPTAENNENAPNKIKYVGMITQVVISNLPSNTQIEDLRTLFAKNGKIKYYQILSTKDEPTQKIKISFDKPEQAHQAINEFNNTEFEGNKLRVESPEQVRRNRGYGPPFVIPFLSLRIIVPMRMLGAIFGKQGSTIKTISQESRARVHVHKEENRSMEKLITIYGNPVSRTEACKKILEIMQQTATNINKQPDITLKILAHNNFTARLIGRGGDIIKKIMQETDTKIAVSSMIETSIFDLEQIITVKGLVENVSKAESLISANLNQSYREDAIRRPSVFYFPGIPPITVLITRLGPCTNEVDLPDYPTPLYEAEPAPNTASEISRQDLLETVCVYIPSNVVGLVIGPDGSEILNMIRCSNADIKIADSEGEEVDSNERKIIIVGSPETQWKAQFMIYDKIKYELWQYPKVELFTVEILVPSSQIRCINGREGENLRELQRATGSTIKLQDITANVSSSSRVEETTVHIIGTFVAVQAAQRHIRWIITPFERPQRPTRGASQESPE